MRRASSAATRAVTSAAPRCRCTGVRWRSALRLAGEHAAARRRCAGSARAPRGASTQSPRADPSASRARPGSARSARRRGALGAGRFCACMAAHRARRAAAGDSTSVSPTCTLPANTVPVTTVPLPAQREAAVDRQRGTAARRRAPANAARPRRSAASRSAATPCAAWRRDTGSTAAPASPVPASSAATSARALAAAPASTRSTLVSATTPRAMPSRSRMCRCSSVCGIDAVVGGDDQQREIDAADAGQHVAHEALVAGHVDEADRAAPSARRQVGEAEIDRDAARLFLRQAVGVDAGQRLAPARSCRGRCGRRCATIMRAERSSPARSARSQQLRDEGALRVVSRQRRSSSSAPSRDAADHRHRQRAKRAPPARRARGLPALGLAGGRRSACARAAVDRQRAAADLARARPPPRRRLARPARRRRSGSSRCGLRLDLRRRPRQQAQRRQCSASRSGSRTAAAPLRARPASACRSAARASAGCLLQRAAIRSARPTMMPACGPPSSLSPLKVTRSAPAASASRGVGSCGRPSAPDRPACRCPGRRRAARRARAPAPPARPRRRRRVKPSIA